MTKCFRFLVVAALVIYIVSPVIAISSYGLPPGYPQSPGYPQAKETKVVYVPVPQKVSTGPTPTPKPTPLPLGTLTITVSPSEATMTIDGSHTVGTTHNLLPGIHTIRVTAPGYLTHTEQVRVNSGDRSYISIVLEKDLNYVERVKFNVKSRPAGASVYVDGKLNGTTPCMVSASAGTHTVVLRLEGYQEQSYTMDLDSTRPQSISAQLVQGVGPLSTPDPVQTEMMRRETPSPSPSTTITRASAHSEEPTDVLQYVIYFFRGVFGGANERDER